MIRLPHARRPGRVAVEPDTLIFPANGERVFALPRDTLPAEGTSASGSGPTSTSTSRPWT